MTIFCFHPFEFDPVAGLVYRGDEETLLPPKATHVLQMLLENAGELVSKDKFLEAVWNGTYVTENSLTDSISLLRRVLGDDTRDPTYIQTLHRRGYRFIGAVVERAAPTPDAERQPSVPGAYEPKGDAKPPEVDSTPFVGRASELLTLKERWTEAREGHGSCVTLAAEPGSGKSTLAQRFTDEISADAAVLVATGRCSERLGSGEAYLPFLEALTELGNSPLGGLVRAVLQSKAPTWFIQLFPGSSGDASFDQLRRELTGGSQERMRRELVDALEELSRSYAVCLALEDLHWSDLATTELIGYLSKRLSDLKVLLVGTYRPAELMAADHPLRSILLDMQASGVAIEIALEFLTEANIQSFIDLEFPGHRFPRELSGWIARKTEGNPLFLVDLLRYLVERQALVKRTNWELARPLESLEGEVPASVRALIERSFQMLSEEQRRWLTVASVQGDSFDLLTLSAVAEIDELRLEEQLETLRIVNRLVQPLGEREFPDGSITVEHRFVHVLYQETLYRALPAKRKMLLHERVGRHLERRHGSRATSVAAALAFHFDRARKSSEAVSYYLSAAKNATSKFAHVQAVAYCDRALELAEGLPAEERDRPLMAIYQARGSARAHMSRFQHAAADFEEMLACTERLGDPDAEAHALCLVADASFYLKEDDKLEHHVERALRIAEHHDLPHRASHGQTLLGGLRLCHGRIDEADELLHRGARDSEQLDLGDVRARNLGWLTQLWFFRGDYERVLARTKQTEALAIEHHDAFALVINYFFTGLSEANFGKLGDGLRTLQQGSSTAEKNNDLFWLGRFPNCVGWIYHEALDFERALAANNEAITIARQTGFLEGEANSQVNVGLAAIELGDFEQAREFFLQAEDVFARDDWYKWRYRLRLENGWSDLYIGLGDLAEARTHATSCQKSAEDTGSRKHLALAHRQLGRIALLEDHVAEAERHLDTAVDLTRDLQSPLAAWRCYLSLGDLYAATHRPDEAAVSRATALQVLRNLADNADVDARASILQSEAVRDLGGQVG